MDINRAVGQIKRHYKTVIVVACFYTVQLLAAATIVYFVSISQTKSFISDINQRADRGIQYKDGIWNTAQYDADPEIPGNYRIYIFTKDGFVIDRWRPIPGYLDTSDFKQLSSYTMPKTINTITGQTWRVYSEPITNANNNTIGLVTVGRYSLQNGTESAIDRQLITVAKDIKNKTEANGSDISTANINVHDVPYQISFHIVDQYNRIHLKSDSSNTIDRLPNFIDPSYIAKELKTPSSKVIRASTGERFLVQSQPLKDGQAEPIGTLVVARTIQPYLDLVRDLLLFGLLLGLVMIPLASALLIKFYNTGKITPAPRTLKLKDINSIKFNKHTSEILINQQKIPITYATNQYYMCQVLFNSPKRKWEIDELAEKFGIDHNINSWRKVYDAMVSINKKAAAIIEPKLIVTNNKTYQINPLLVVKITQQ